MPALHSRIVRRRIPRVFAASVLLGCGAPSVKDAGIDSGVDAGPRPDAGAEDGGRDASVYDSGVDAGFDAGTDAGFDAGTDGGFFRDGGYDGGDGNTCYPDAPGAPAECCHFDQFVMQDICCPNPVDRVCPLCCFNPTSADGGHLYMPDSGTPVCYC